MRELAKESDQKSVIPYIFVYHGRIRTQIQGCFKASAAVILLNGLTVNI